MSRDVFVRGGGWPATGRPDRSNARLDATADKSESGETLRGAFGGVMLKGVGLDVLYPNFLALFVFTAILVGVSAWRFESN